MDLEYASTPPPPGACGALETTEDSIFHAFGRLKIEAATVIALNTDWPHRGSKFHRRILERDLNTATSLQEALLANAKTNFRHLDDNTSVSWNDFLIHLGRQSLGNPFDIQSLLVDTVKSSLRQVYKDHDQGDHNNNARVPLVGHTLVDLLVSRSQDASTSEPATPDANVVISLTEATLAMSQNQTQVTTAPFRETASTLRSLADGDNGGLLNLLQDEVVKHFEQNSCRPLKTKFVDKTVTLSEREASHIVEGGKRLLSVDIFESLLGLVNEGHPHRAYLIKLAHKVLTSSKTATAAFRSSRYSNVECIGLEESALLPVYFYVSVAQSRVPEEPQKWSTLAFVPAGEVCLLAFDAATVFKAEVPTDCPVKIKGQPVESMPLKTVQPAISSGAAIEDVPAAMASLQSPPLCFPSPSPHPADTAREEGVPSAPGSSSSTATLVTSSSQTDNGSAIVKFPVFPTASNSSNNLNDRQKEVQELVEGFPTHPKVLFNFVREKHSHLGQDGLEESGGKSSLHVEVGSSSVGSPAKASSDALESERRKAWNLLEKLNSEIDPFRERRQAAEEINIRLGACESWLDVGDDKLTKLLESFQARRGRPLTENDYEKLMVMKRCFGETLTEFGLLPEVFDRYEEATERIEELRMARLEVKRLGRPRHLEPTSDGDQDDITATKTENPDSDPDLRAGHADAVQDLRSQSPLSLLLGPELVL